jgi:hypothetical protein
MSIRTLAARGLSFAHLAGLSSRAARAENEDDERKQRDGESDEDYAKRMEELDNEEEKARKAEEERKEEEARKAEEQRKEEEARRAEDNKDDDPSAEDDEEEMRGKSAAARARRRERARCAAIFASPAAARNPVLAANLAFTTEMSRRSAIAMLEGTPAPASASHATRAARNPNLSADGGAKPSQQQALAARWDANLKAANPHRR